MTQITFHDDDIIPLEFTINKSDGSGAQDITGATIVALAKKATSGQVVELDTTITDGANGVLEVDIEKTSVTAGVWELQVYITLTSGQAQTPVHRPMTVEESFDAP